MDSKNIRFADLNHADLIKTISKKKIKHHGPNGLNVLDRASPQEEEFVQNKMIAMD